MTKASEKSKKGKTTAELPAVRLEDAAGGADVVAEPSGDSADNSPVTRELEAISPQTPDSHTVPDADVAGEDETGPAAEMRGPVAHAHAQDADDAGYASDANDPDANDPDANDPDATVQRAAATPPEPERPRHNTLAAITRPRGGTNPHGAPRPPEPEQPILSHDSIPDETDYAAQDEDEWSIADQPTVALAPGSVLSARPQFLDTDEHSVWPPRPAPDASFAGTLPEAAASLRRRAIPRPDRTGPRRFASPDGEPMPDTPPTGIPRTAFPDPRMQRFQELHRRRDAKEQGELDPSSDKNVTERVRQWWTDLRPGLQKALDYQHEARASGVHPIPAYEQAPSSRLGDVFGRLTASARELTERVQSAAAPAFKRLHDQAEHAAQGIVGRFEPDTARQQAPFLGPGRIAVFFRSGVSVGQAQRLLSSNEARPLRIIPRKHGFLAYVLPGTEAKVSGRLRIHPYVRDVVFMPLNEYGDPDERDRDDDL